MNFVDKALHFRQELRRFVWGWVRPQILASEMARAELNRELKERWKPHSIEVYELILDTSEPNQISDPSTARESKDKRFIVFIDPDFDIDWITDCEMDAGADKSVSIAESIGARRCKHLPREQILELKRLVGQAIINGIRGETEESLKLTEGAAQFLKDRTVERSRSWTLTSAHFFVLLFSAVLALFWHFSGTLLLWQTTDAFLLWAAIQGGLIGAYLSVVQKAGRGEWDAAAGESLHRVEVFTRLWAGGTLGGIAFALARSAHAPESLKGIVPDTYSALILGVVAGLFERTIPKMISSYSNFQKSDNQ